jgi:hypothetical protein
LRLLPLWSDAPPPDLVQAEAALDAIWRGDLQGRAFAPRWWRTPRVGRGFSPPRLLRDVRARLAP